MNDSNFASRITPPRLSAPQPSTSNLPPLETAAESRPTAADRPRPVALRLAKIVAAGFTFLTAGLAAQTASATLIGYNTDPAGAAWDRFDADTGFATWDTFPNNSSPGNGRIDFTNDAPDSSFGMTTPLLSQPTVATVTNQGVGIYDVGTGTASAGTNGDVLFGGANTVNFSFTGSVSFTIRGIVLQIKRAGNTAGFSGNYFDPRLTISGAGITSVGADAQATTSGTGDTSADVPDYGVTSFYWNTSLAGNTGNSTYTIAINKTGFQRSLDGFALDVGNSAVVPEPTAAVLGAIGLFCGLARRRRRAATPSVPETTASKRSA